MATAAELAASLKDDGYNVSQPGGGELPAMVGATPPTAIEQIVQPAIDIVKDPSGVAQAALQGVNKSFGDFIPDLTEKIQGTMSFPIIRPRARAISTSSIPLPSWKRSECRTSAGRRR